jgi:hypothetical protein
VHIYTYALAHTITSATVLVHATGALPILVVPLYLSGELATLAAYPYWAHYDFVAIFTFMCCCTLVYQMAAVT